MMITVEQLFLSVVWMLNSNDADVRRTLNSVRHPDHRPYRDCYYRYSFRNFEKTIRSLYRRVDQTWCPQTKDPSLCLRSSVVLEVVVVMKEDAVVVVVVLTLMTIVKAFDKRKNFLMILHV